jgi:hypothetical protein
VTGDWTFCTPGCSDACSGEHVEVLAPAPGTVRSGNVQVPASSIMTVLRWLLAVQAVTPPAGGSGAPDDDHCIGALMLLAERAGRVAHGPTAADVDRRMAALIYGCGAPSEG